MYSDRLQKALAMLAILLIAGGIIVTAMPDPDFSGPAITIITTSPGGKVTFRIHFYLLRFKTYLGPILGPDAYRNQYLSKIELPDPANIYSRAIRVWDPDGTLYIYLGNIVLQKSPSGADMSYFVDIYFDPSDQDGWSKVPRTDIPGIYKVDFEGRYYLSDGSTGQFFFNENFDILHEFRAPEMPALPVALVLSGIAVLLLRKRLLK
jgi:hypothetical protein